MNKFGGHKKVNRRDFALDLTERYYRSPSNGYEMAVSANKVMCDKFTYQIFHVTGYRNSS